MGADGGLGLLRNIAGEGETSFVISNHRRWLPCLCIGGLELQVLVLGRDGRWAQLGHHPACRVSRARGGAANWGKDATCIDRNITG